MYGRFRYWRYLFGRAIGLLLVAVTGIVDPLFRLIRTGTEQALDSLITVTPL
jgi:hypothetical protein